MVYIPPKTTCPTCNGDGLDSDKACLTCFGTGSTPVTSKTLLLFKSITDQCNDILDKCNDIFEKVNE